MNVTGALDKLFKLHTFGVKLGLDNVKKFLSYLGNPQSKLKAIHIAGSNGKGSTASFIASILMENGFKVGLYTSPHFIKFNERIVINGRQIPDYYVADFIEKHWEYIIPNKLTFFEVTTAMAFKYFYENKIDYAVVETGLGGRLDATNVLNPLSVVITSISLEHTNVLGSRLTEIAKEKAAIIKAGAKVFTGILPAKADKIIEEKCKEENCPFYRIDEYIIEQDDDIKLYTEEIELEEWEIPLKGKYQKYNAALAVLTVVKSLLIDDEKHIEKGLVNVIQNTGIQGRYEFFNKQPDVIFDSAHNLDGLQQFLEAFKISTEQYGQCSVLFGCMKDKDAGKMLKLLNKEFDNIYVTQIDYERSAGIEELLEISRRENIEVEGVDEPASFIKNFIKNKPDDCLVVLGSMYILGEVKKKLLL